MAAGIAGQAVASDSPDARFAVPAGGIPDVQGITPGKTFVADASGEAVPALAPITLHIKATAWNKISVIKRVRLFRLGAKDVPDPFKRFVDCDVFLTVVLTDLNTGRDFVQLQPLSRPFLEVDKAHTTLKASRWLAIFETSAQEPGPVFRLSPSSQKEYFDAGFIFTLSPDKGEHQYTLEEVTAAEKGQLVPRDWLDNLNLHDNSVPCHIASMTRVTANDEHVQVMACARDDELIP